MNDEQMNYERAKIFLNKELLVHVSLKDGTFYNGLITEVSADFFFINDREDGRQLVFFKQLKRYLVEYKDD